MVASPFRVANNSLYPPSYHWFPSSGSTLSNEETARISRNRERGVLRLVRHSPHFARMTAWGISSQRMLVQVLVFVAQFCWPSHSVILRVCDFFPTVILSGVRRTPNVVEGPHIRWQQQCRMRFFHGALMHSPGHAIFQPHFSATSDQR